jgi:hypothetical protein
MSLKTRIRELLGEIERVAPESTRNRT